jgi:phage terminase large subunit-like protein
MKPRLTATSAPKEAAVVELPRLGRTSRTTLVTVTSLRSLHRLVACNVVLGVATLSLLLWRSW